MGAIVDTVAGTSGILNNIVDVIKKIILKTLEVPFNLIKSLPWWVRMLFLLIILLGAAALVAWYIKNKDEWMHVRME